MLNLDVLTFQAKILKLHTLWNLASLTDFLTKSFGLTPPSEPPDNALM